MFKEPIDIDNELEELEKEMGTTFEGMENAPMRAEFKEELRDKLQNRIEEAKEAKEAPSSSNKKELYQKGKENRSSLVSLVKNIFGGNGSGGAKNWKAVTSVVMIIIMLAAVFWGVGDLGFNPKPVNASEVTIKALSADKMGVEPDSAFLLTSVEPLDESTVESALKVSPAFTYALDKQAGGREYKIIPKEALSPNTIYTLSFDSDGMGKENVSWAFQTKAKFRVMRSLPNNQSTHVPLDTGIEILFSHESYDFSKIKDYFNIAPQVEGTFEQHKKTMVFIPKALKPSTIYTVTLKKGLVLAGSSETLKEDYVFSFETAPAEANKLAFNFDLDTNLTEFSTSDTPAFPVYFYNEYSSGNTGSTPALKIDLYRYPDYKAFQASLAKRDHIPSWAYYTWNRYKEDLNAQYKMAEYKTEFLKANDYSYYIVFPQQLEAGYYAAEFEAGDSTRQVWFQVTDLAVYLAQGEESTLIWASDLSTKKAAADVQVMIDSKSITAKGDKSGAVLLKEKLMGEKRDYALVKGGNKETLVPLEAFPYWYNKNSSHTMDYWKYLYLDRELYQPEDTVNFWGVLAARDKGKEQVSTITLELMGSDGPYYEGAEISPVLTQKVEVKDKTFNGQIKLPVLKPGYYYLQLKIGDTPLLSRGFEIQTYHKPSYKLSLTQDEKAIFAGEPLNFQAKTTFFEGTPVPGLKLNYHIEGKEGTVTTNDQGETVIAYTGILQHDDYSSYRYVSLGVNASLPEMGEIYNSGELYVFKSKVYLTGEAKKEADGYSLDVKLSNVDLTGINNGEYISEEHFLKGAVANSPIKASLFQEVWTQEEAGERYDFISKKVVKIYNYNYATKHMEDFELTTGADGQASYSGKIDPKQSYYIDLTAKDSEGRLFTKRIHVGSYSGYGPGYQHYSLQGKPGVQGYKPGEEVQVTFMVNDKEVEPSDQSVLYFKGQRYIDSYEVSGSSKHTFKFLDEYVPNVNVYGVYFDGHNFYEASNLSVAFAKETKALNVNVETDQAEYRPGGKVKLGLQVTDPNNKAVRGAQVNLNLVDEALFSLREQNVNFLNSLYGEYLYFTLSTRKSHNHPQPEGGAEKGGEGGGERQDFQDTVLFKSVLTDSQGKAEIEFELPDNLTSWRVTYHAFTEDLQAGSGTAQIPVRLPFFIEMTHNDSYLEGDSPVVILRSYGEKLKGSQSVAYTMKLKDSKGKETSWTLNGTAYDPVDWELPKLENGSYTLTVSANSGNFSDSIMKKFEVSKSFQQRTVTDHKLLAADMNLEGSPVEPTTVVFSDYEKSQYLRGLYQLAWNNGSRLEQKLAGIEARKLLKEYFPEENIFGDWAEQESLLMYQQNDGGISILPYSGSELPLTAMVASSTNGIFDRKAMAGYLYHILEAQGEDRSLALLGLAALKEPVLLQINDYLQQENLEPAVKINLAMALLEIGDGRYAETVFRDLIKPYAEDLGAVMRINVGRDQDEIIEATTQMALLASRLDQPEKHKLYQYLLENEGKDILNLVEQLQILKYNLKYMQSSPVSLTYTLNGEKVTKSLKDREIYKLSLLPEDLSKIKISQVEGKVGVVSKYGVPIKAGETGNAEDLKISRTYMVNDRKTNTVGRSDIVQVVITYNIGDKAPAGLYEIIDVLPAGLVHLSQPYHYHGDPNFKFNSPWSYPSEVNGQRLVFQVSKGQYKLTYLARVMSPGEFISEAPVISNIKNNGIYTSGSAEKLVIK